MLRLLGFILSAYGLSLVFQGVRELLAAGPSRRNVRLKASAPTFQTPLNGIPGSFAAARPGATIVYRHPERGETRGVVRGTIQYTELWQRRKSPSEPWVPTGNRFTAHWLDGTLLYAWKGSLWLLDEFESVTDVEIKQHFAGPARRFGESDETDRVNFAYPPGSWLITDIGKFRVQEIWGAGLRLTTGAAGRFIHAAGDTGLAGRALVVEDYLEGQGGQDTVWRGWRIEWEDLVEIHT